MAQRHPGVFGGVDTHKHTHVAAVLDAAGRLLGTAAFDADTVGYAALLEWLRGHGSVERVGVEGTGSYGAGLARSLAAADVDVVDVNRPNRQMRRRRGKTDTVDAEAAARAALNGDAAVVPKSADGCVEAIRTLGVARRSAVKARTVAANQIDAVVVTAPEHLKDRLRALNTARTVEACARLRHPGTDSDPVLAAAKQALRSLARRHQALTAEIKHLDAELRRLCERVNPALLSACGVGAETAAALLVAAGDNPRQDAQRGVVRRPVWHQPGRGVLRPDRAPPAQPRRQPTRQQRPVAHSDGPPARRRAQHRLRRPPHRRGQDPPRDTPLPQAPHRTRGLQADHRPARRRQRGGPAPAAHPTRAHHPLHRPSPRSRTQPDLRTRKRHHPQLQPRRTLPTTPRCEPELTNIGASTCSKSYGAAPTASPTRATSKPAAS